MNSQISSLRRAAMGLLLLALLLPACATVEPPQATGTPQLVVTAEPGEGYPPPNTIVPPTPPYPPPPTQQALPTQPPYIQPPLCQPMSSATPEPTGPTLEQFLFSSSQRVTTLHPVIDLIQWLPDSRRVLFLGGDGVGEAIETIDVFSGETQVYAQGLQNPSLVLWLPEENAVVYTDKETALGSGIDRKALWISYGDPQNVQILLEDSDVIGTHAPLPELPGNLAERLRPSLPFDPELWRYSKYPPETMQGWKWLGLGSYRSPDGSLIAFYGPPWLFLVDAATNQPCEVELGGGSARPLRAFEVKWSADGRFLAMLTTADFPGELMPFAHLAIYDTASGSLFQSSQINYVTDMDWLTNSHYLLTLGFNNPSTQDHYLYAVDALTSEFHPLLEDQVFWGNFGSDQELFVSPDGQYLALRCRDGGLCLVEVVRNP